MPRAPRSRSAMRVRVSSTASINASSVNRRCGTSKCVDSPAPQWSATNNPTGHAIRMANRKVCGFHGAYSSGEVGSCLPMRLQERDFDSRPSAHPSATVSPSRGGTSLSRFRMIKDVHPQAELGKEISSSEVHTGHTARAGDGRPFLSDGKVGWGGWTRTNTVLINSGNFDVQDVRNVQCVQQNALGGRKLLRAFSLANWTPEWTPHQFLRFSKS